MGRIKSALVKRTSKQIMQKVDLFTEEFEYNKKILGNTMPSKKMRNKIAGYISRMKKMQKRKLEESDKNVKTVEEDQI